MWRRWGRVMWLSTLSRWPWPHNTDTIHCSSIFLVRCSLFPCCQCCIRPFKLNIMLSQPICCSFSSVSVLSIQSDQSNVFAASANCPIYRQLFNVISSSEVPSSLGCIICMAFLYHFGLFTTFEAPRNVPRAQNIVACTVSIAFSDSPSATWISLIHPNLCLHIYISLLIKLRRFQPHLHSGFWRFSVTSYHQSPERPEKRVERSSAFGIWRFFESQMIPAYASRSASSWSAEALLEPIRDYILSIMEESWQSVAEAVKYVESLRHEGN